MTTPLHPSPASAALRAQLADVRNGLLRLHKVLLDWERIRYERSNGRISDNMKLLHLTMNDPAFAWLRELSALIVEIDERMEDKKVPLTDFDAKSHLRESRTLLSPSQTGGDFQRNYYWALQETPDIVVAHAGMVKLLAGSGSGDLVS
jgi:hypothetical protein